MPSSSIFGPHNEVGEPVSPSTPALSTALIASTPIVSNTKAPTVSPLTSPPFETSATPAKAMSQPPESTDATVFHGFDDFLDKIRDSFDDLIYMGLDNQ
ncbi:hypothetical protein K458DRAFT_391975 [Lentithecium fluviatile CBS 122367]|uniref:Uncharacterized protein n=1 Tax=Lentithecium fluviatile CBS 122367 TaxID=1168545 RepID=A0A6G1ISV0_9PLEO|nr:hypothetical protein K458DRAFT_391975 [Lentithecium fluviatile CBS 122367]